MPKFIWVRRRYWGARLIAGYIKNRIAHQTPQILSFLLLVYVSNAK